MFDLDARRLAATASNTIFGRDWCQNAAAFWYPRRRLQPARRASHSRCDPYWLVKEQSRPAGPGLCEKPRPSRRAT